LCESGHLVLLIVARFVRRRRHAADGLEQAPRVKPVDPDQRGRLDGLPMTLRPSALNDLGFEEANHGFREGVVGIP